MTPKQQAVIDRARASVPRFIEFDSRVLRHTAAMNHMKDRMKQANALNTACLQAEFDRIVKTWSK